MVERVAGFVFIFRSNIDYVVREIKNFSAGISAIKRNRSIVSRETLLSTYNAIVQPDYCSTVWGDCAKNLADN